VSVSDLGRGGNGDSRRGGEVAGSMPRLLRERLARYHQIATRAGEAGQSTVSSAFFAEILGVDDTLVRKDMAAAGITGRPKVGFATRDILARLDELIGLAGTWEAILIGCGQLGSAVVGYPGFARYGLKIAGVFDIDHAKLGRTVAGHPVLPMEKCRSVIEIFAIEIAILTVPAAAAQELAEWLVERGIRAIWNFAPVNLRVPPGVVVRDENLALGLAQLIHSYKQAKQKP
jgi:redox-sensing transcriptional repressor